MSSTTLSSDNQKTVRTRVPADQRKWKRLPVSFPLFVSGTDERGKAFNILAIALNVSAGGLCLAIDHRIRPISPILVKMPLGNISKEKVTSDIHELHSVIVRTEHRERRRLLGVKFNQVLC